MSAAAQPAPAGPQDAPRTLERRFVAGAIVSLFYSPHHPFRGRGIGVDGLRGEEIAVIIGADEADVWRALEQLRRAGLLAELTRIGRAWVRPAAYNLQG